MVGARRAGNVWDDGIGEIGTEKLGWMLPIMTSHTTNCGVASVCQFSRTSHLRISQRVSCFQVPTSHLVISPVPPASSFVLAVGVIDQRARN